ncbi:GrpB family protein [Bradyrhizobium guangxiense]|uniref:GrpB family protein n=1 Tax=Bradyrhizobium guangxiense TaxID=1325115 RepID=UPI001FDFED68|nr:GrpB family protein [Bradyrhizobium guangxiense]
MERYGAGAIEVRDYDPNWPVLFEEERIRLQFVIGSTLKIEHMGSTSVLGLAAKSDHRHLGWHPKLVTSEMHAFEASRSTGI